MGTGDFGEERPAVEDGEVSQDQTVEDPAKEVGEVVVVEGAEEVRPLEAAVLDPIELLRETRLGRRLVEEEVDAAGVLVLAADSEDQ